MAFICAHCENIHRTREDLGLKCYRESQPLMYDRGYADVDVADEVCIECGSDDIYEDTALECQDCGEIFAELAAPQAGDGEYACPHCGHTWIEEI